MRFGSFVRFGVLSSVQPQNVAMRHFGSFGNMGRQPTTFGPRGTPWPDAALAVLHELCCSSADCSKLHGPQAACLHACDSSSRSGLAPSTLCSIFPAAVDAFHEAQEHVSMVAFMSMRWNHRPCGTSGDPGQPREVVGCACVGRECTGPGRSFIVKRMSTV